MTLLTHPENVMRIPVLALALLTASAVVSAEVDRAAIEATVAQINTEAEVTSIKPSAIPGLNEVIADGVVLYISDDGRHLLHGVLLDVPNRRNLTETAMATIRVGMLAKVRPETKIVYRPEGEPKHVVQMFTDVSCGYCKQVHDQIKDYLALGIQVEMLAFPRGGEQAEAYATMDAIWCAQDRAEAYDHALLGQPVVSDSCASPVRAHYMLGEKLGVQGTPTFYTEYGEQIGGYATPDELLRTLDRGRAKHAKSTAAR
jgi:thiol:disulfide interchange protein DsbC